MDTITNLMTVTFTDDGQITLFEISGLIGVALYVVNYAALQLGQIDGNSIRYTVLNGTAASLVLISLIQDWNLASALIQIMWIGISIMGIGRALFSRKRRVEQALYTIDAASEYRDYPKRPQWPEIRKPRDHTATTELLPEQINSY